MENKVISTEYVKKNFIYKDKIRKKIEEIDNTGLNIGNEQLNYQMKLEDNAKIQVLKELLEETENE